MLPDIVGVLSDKNIKLMSLKGYINTDWMNSVKFIGTWRNALIEYLHSYFEC
jgi:hypothetical protein